MSVTIGPSYITHADGSTQGSKSDVTPPWGNVSGRPTDLGAFSNSPNYLNGTFGWNCIGGVLAGAYSHGGNANCSNCYPVSMGWQGYTSGTAVSGYPFYNNCNPANCNCNCNCNC
jgi:hypothetical protein